MPEILVFCEKDETAFELLSKGRELKDSLNAKLAGVILGKGSEERTSQYFAYGADKVYLAKQDVLANIHADVYAEAIAQIVNSSAIELVLIGSTRAGKELAPRVAQKLGAGCVTDAIDIRVKDRELLVDRYSLGGNTVASVVIKTPKKVVSAMPRAFELGEKAAKQGEVVNTSLNLKSPRLRVMERQEKKGESAPIEEAETLVCIGRGLSDRKDIPLIEALARAMKAEIGCTRSLTHDWQWFPESREVGLSGKKCKPRLCLCIGISGQIQHTVGIRSSKVIAAINKDKNAPIFKIADYGIVGDLYDVVPRLTQRIQSLSVSLARS